MTRPRNLTVYSLNKQALLLNTNILINIIIFNKHVDFLDFYTTLITVT